MDISAIKSKLTQLQSTTSTKENFWKPEPGKQVVRIVPYKHNKDNPFMELYFHYNLGGNKTYLSPATFGRPDPVEEFSNKLKSTGNKDEWVLGKRLEPKMRTFVPVVVRGREDEGVKFWGFGKTVYQELLSVIADPDYGDITDAMNGRDIGIERQTPAEAGNQYGKTTVRVKPNQSKLVEDSEALENLLNNQANITELYTEPSYDDLKEALSNYLNPSEESESATTETKTTETTAAPVANKVSDTSDAFDQLFNS